MRERCRRTQTGARQNDRLSEEKKWERIERYSVRGGGGRQAGRQKVRKTDTQMRQTRQRGTRGGEGAAERRQTTRNKDITTA